MVKTKSSDASSLEMMANGLPSITRQALHEQVRASLQEAIITGYFAPGQKVSLRAVAAELGTSTMPVRAAVNKLVGIGALDMLDNGRVRVPLLTVQRYLDLMQARTLVEPAAAEASVPLISDEDCEKLVRLHYEMCEITQQPHSYVMIRSYLSCNKKFHFIVYSSVGSKLLLDFIESLWVRTGPFFHLLHKKSSDWGGNENHAKILEAVQNRDSAAIKQAVSRDLESAAKRIVLDEIFTESG